MQNLEWNNRKVHIEIQPHCSVPNWLRKAQMLHEKRHFFYLLFRNMSPIPSRHTYYISHCVSYFSLYRPAK